MTRRKKLKNTNLIKNANVGKFPEFFRKKNQKTKVHVESYVYFMQYLILCYILCILYISYVDKNFKIQEIGFRYTSTETALVLKVTNLSMKLTT